MSSNYSRRFYYEQCHSNQIYSIEILLIYDITVLPVKEIIHLIISEYRQLTLRYYKLAHAYNKRKSNDVNN